MNFSVPDFPDLQFGSVYCIGRNYARHAAEMKSELPSEPVVFLKPRSSLIRDSSSVLIPPHVLELQHEVELVILIGQKTRNISSVDALSYVKAFGVGLDMTARDIQSEAKKSGLPWTLAKGFDTFAPLGNLADFGKGSDYDLSDLDLEVSVNGEVRQSGNTSDMLFPVSEIISYLSVCFTLYPGDLIFTGTPEGVGRVNAGDIVSATIGSGISSLQIYVKS